jgi:uncharacterized membrane protein YqjE
MDIKDSIFKFLRLDNLVENLSGYFETRVELIKIEIREEIAKVISHGLLIGMVFLLAMLFLVFFSVGLAHYLSSYFNNAYLGFWVVSGIYGVPGLILVLFRKKISQYFEQHLIAQAKQKKK